MILGIEIGGTKLQLAVGTGQRAEFAAMERRDIVPARGATGILEQIEAAVGELRLRFDIDRVGIGFGGPVNGVAGRVITSHQVDGWTDFDFAGWMRQRLNLPLALGNDCDCAALAEATFGAGQGHRTVFYVTVGTGVGGGLVIDGRVHGTDRPSVAEIGHLRPGLAANDAHATVESLASGWGIAATARACVRDEAGRIHDRLLPLGRPVLSDTDRRDLLARCGDEVSSLTTLMIGQAAADGNAGAGAILKTATDVLGWAVAQVMAIVSPDIVVVGGGVSLTGDELFYAPLREAIAVYLFPPLRGAWQLAGPQLGEEVVVHGAIALGGQMGSHT